MMTPASVIGQTLAERRRAIAWWSAGFGALTVFFSATYPSIRDSEALKSFFADLPPSMLAVFGVDPDLIFTGAGFVQTQIHGLVGPIGVLALCIGIAARATAGEERDGTMDLLLALPISRGRVFAEKAAAMVLESAIVVAALTATLVVCSAAFAMHLELSGLVSANLGLWLLGLLFGSVTLTIGALTGNPSLATAVASATALLAWVVTSFSPIYSWLQPASAFSPFTWYGSHQPLLGNWSITTAWLALTAAALAVLAAWLFRRRDIGTELTVLPRRKKRRRAGRKVAPRSAWLLGSVFGKSVWDYRRSIFVWAGGLCLLIVITAAAWPTMSRKLDTVRSLMKSLPRELLALLGMTDAELLATPAGFVSSRAYLTVGPVVMIVLCVGAVARLLIREERSHVLDLVLGSGSDRRRVLIHKLAAIAAIAGGVVMTMTIVLLIANVAFETGIPLGGIVGANIGLALLGLCFAGIAAALWGVLGARGSAIPITVALAVAAHLLNAIGSIVPTLSALRWASPFYWYIGDTVPLGRGVPPSYLLLLIGAVGGGFIAVRRVTRRDIGA